MLRWLMRLVIVGLIGLGVAYAISRLMGQDEDFDDFDDIEAGFEFEETPVEIDVPAEAGGAESSGGTQADGGLSWTGTETGAEAGTSEESVARGKQTGILGGGGAAGDSGGGSLIDINGIGPNYAARLEAAGITSIADLAAADAEDIASKMDVIGGSSAIEDWIAQAKSMNER